MHGSVIDTSRIPGDGAAAARRPRIVLPNRGMPSTAEAPRWHVLTLLKTYPNQDIDWWRKRYGKADGERRFFGAFEPDQVEIVPGNMLLGNGASALFQQAMGNGTTSANSALGSGPTYYNNAQTSIYVGDGGITAGSGTVSVTNGSASLTFSTSQSSLQGKYIVVTGDTTHGLYVDTTSSGTSHTLATTYQGPTNASASWSYLTAESHSQTGLQGSSNVAHQVMDATFPANSTSAQFNAITGATNASPIVLTVSGADISTNDFVLVSEVNGNTAANGMFVANPASSSSITLLGSTGNAAYTYGGLVTKRNVWRFQATFGPSVLTFPLWEWGIVNGTGGNQNFLNRKCWYGGSPAGTTSLQTAIGLA